MVTCPKSLLTGAQIDCAKCYVGIHPSRSADEICLRLDCSRGHRSIVLVILFAFRAGD